MTNPFLTYAHDILTASQRLTANLQQNRNWMGNGGTTAASTAGVSRSGARGSNKSRSRSRSRSRSTTPATTAQGTTAARR